MEAKNFRLGNTIKFGEREISISRHDIDNMAKMEITEGAISELYKPIDLTEKWLISFGFVGRHNMWSNGIITVGYIATDEHFEYEFQFPFNHWTKNSLKYVHELQNLFFALTGDEPKPRM